MHKKILAASLLSLLLAAASLAQTTPKAEITFSISETFFDALLDSIYQNFDPPQFTIAMGEPQPSVFEIQKASFFPGREAQCAETVKLLRENNGVKTSVRFRDGKTSVPIAFSGSYEAPLIGCIEFSGLAETTMDLEFDSAAQKLLGRLRVSNVNLNGTGGVGGTLIAKLIQSSIDKKMNPIEIIRLDKISFGIPIQNVGNIAMKATGIRTEVVNRALNIAVAYSFSKG